MAHDDEFGKSLHTLLTDEQLPPSTVDIGRAIASGRRRRNAGYGAGALAVLTLAVTVPVAIQSLRPQAPPAAPTASCVLDPGPAAMGSLFTDANGRYFAGRVHIGGGNSYPALWENGQVRQVPMPDRRYGTFTAINAKGQAIGNSYLPADGTSDIDRTAFIYSDGAVTLLSGGENVYPTSLNDSGAVAGLYQTPKETRPVMWPHPGAPRVDLAFPPGTTPSTLSVLEDGSIIGILGTGNDLAMAYRWQTDGSGAELTLPDGADAGTIRAAGHWVHGFYDWDGVAGIFIIDLQTGAVRKAPGVSIHPGLTAFEWVAGWKGRTDGTDAGRPGLPLVITDGTTILDLPLESHQQMVTAISASADGSVVTGYTMGSQPEPQVRSFIWYCPRVR